MVGARPDAGADTKAAAMIDPRHLSCDHDTPDTCGQADFIRADGACLCPICQREYRHHLYCRHSYSAWADVYTLHVICTGLHVKL